MSSRRSNRPFHVEAGCRGGGGAPERGSLRPKPSSRTGRKDLTTVSGTMVGLAQHAKSYGFKGNQRGKKITSGGRAGSPAHGHAPNSASHRRVKTRARSSPPRSRTNSRAM